MYMENLYESPGERILKIGPHLPNIKWLTFWDTVYFIIIIIIVTIVTIIIVTAIIKQVVLLSQRGRALLCVCQ